MRRLLVVSFLILGACVPDSTTTITNGTTTSDGGREGTTSTTAPVTTSSMSGATTSTTAPAPLLGLAYAEVAKLDFPVQVTAIPGDQTSYVITKDGRVWAMQEGSILDTPVLDISETVRDKGEQGLLSIALGKGHGSVFLHYSDNNGDTVVSSFEFKDPLHVDPASEAVLLQLDQPAANHNGGMLYLADGILYLGLGDGGGAGDRFQNGQNIKTLLGGIVSIPTDGLTAPRLFAYGLRNPWRFWIDEGLMYVADVGQDHYEEISVTEFIEGLNFGWSIMEGLHCFRPSSGCDQSDLVLPVVEVAHGDAGTCSITGGVVYRGDEIPELDGAYLYSDYCGGYLRSLTYIDGRVRDQQDWTDQVGIAGRVSGFGVDGFGEVYVTTSDALLRLVPVR